MNYEILLSPARYDESAKPVRVPMELWRKIIRAVTVHGGAQIDYYDACQARDFVCALRNALVPRKPQPPARARYAVFQPAYSDPGAELLQGGMGALLEEVIAIFDLGSVRVQKTVASAIRALPAR